VLSRIPKADRDGDAIGLAVAADAIDVALSHAMSRLTHKISGPRSGSAASQC
jgi:hypothetical protein